MSLIIMIVLAAFVLIGKEEKYMLPFGIVAAICYIFVAQNIQSVTQSTIIDLIIISIIGFLVQKHWQGTLLNKFLDCLVVGMILFLIYQFYLACQRIGFGRLLLLAGLHLFIAITYIIIITFIFEFLPQKRRTLDNDLMAYFILFFAFINYGNYYYPPLYLVLLISIFLWRLSCYHYWSLLTKLAELGPILYMFYLWLQRASLSSIISWISRGALNSDLLYSLGVLIVLKVLVNFLENHGSKAVDDIGTGGQAATTTVNIPAEHTDNEIGLAQKVRVLNNYPKLRNLMVTHYKTTKPDLFQYIYNLDQQLQCEYNISEYDIDPSQLDTAHSLKQLLKRHQEIVEQLSKEREQFLRNIKPLIEYDSQSILQGLQILVNHSINDVEEYQKYELNNQGSTFINIIKNQQRKDNTLKNTINGEIAECLIADKLKQSLNNLAEPKAMLRSLDLKYLKDKRTQLDIVIVSRYGIFEYDVKNSLNALNQTVQENKNVLHRKGIVNTIMHSQRIQKWVHAQQNSHAAYYDLQNKLTENTHLAYIIRTNHNLPTKKAGDGIQVYSTNDIDQVIDDIRFYQSPYPFSDWQVDNFAKVLDQQQEKSYVHSVLSKDCPQIIDDMRDFQIEISKINKEFKNC